MIRITIIESPYAGDVERNLRYVRACMRDCFDRGEIPFASHALYTQPGVLNDDDPEERSKGIGAGLKLSRVIHEAAQAYPPAEERRCRLCGHGEHVGICGHTDVSEPIRCVCTYVDPQPAPAWGGIIHTAAFYMDLGWSKGMEGAFQFALRNGFNIEERRLGGEWE